MRTLRYGRTGVLLELDSSAAVTAAYRRLRAACTGGRLAGVVELVPAARTVLVSVAIGASPPVERLRELLADLSTDEEPVTGSEAPMVTLPVRYDGEDLALVARTAGCGIDDVVRLHSSGEYTVAFCGFAPGFGYLVGLPQPLRQPRLADSRPSIPAGSVGVAGEFTGVYPRRSPGGWRLIGRTEQVMFDPSADPPALLTPGYRVRFEPLV
ncbi:MAG: 5-oxoprolinase subunit PxpB [Pseudonocardia sp.]|nr:5-oxoprolinase subunit PxpB [Pseudonocardia sp.]